MPRRRPVKKSKAVAAAASNSNSNSNNNGSDSVNGHDAITAIATSNNTSTNQRTLIQGRVELFFKDEAELQQRVQWLSKQYGVTAFNLVNKHQTDAVNGWVQTIQKELPDADVCAHYSLKYNKVPRRGMDAHMGKWAEHWKSTTATEVLMISGSTTKAAIGETWNTATVVQQFQLQKRLDKNNPTKLAVAYNPYFPYAKDRLQELQKLETKLRSGCVDKVYFQFGTDLVALKEALNFLQQKQATTSFSLAGSIFLPTAKLIAQQKFRPWNGVFLSPDFLAGPEQATQIVLEIMKLYKKHHVEILWEAPGIRTDKDMEVVQYLQEQLSISEGKIVENPTAYSPASSSTDVVSDNEDDSYNATPISEVSQKNPAQTIPSKRARVEREQKRSAAASGLTAKAASRSLQEDDIARQSKDACVLIFGTHDVRLYDNRAVYAAVSKHKTVIPVFLWNPQNKHVLGALQVVVKDALRSLQKALQPFKLELICRNCEDDGVKELQEIIQKTSSTHVYWNKGHSTEMRSVEADRLQALQLMGVKVGIYQTSLLYDPESISLSKGFHGGHWGTLMPFLKNCLKAQGEPPQPIPKHKTFGRLQTTKALKEWPASDGIDGLLMAVMPPKTDWNKPILQRFPMSEEHAKKTLESFFKLGFAKYERERSRADKEWATSNLSVHLRVGTLSPYELYWRVKSSTLSYNEIKTFSRRLIWRDLAYFQLCCFPDIRYVSIRKHYENTAWVTGAEATRRLEAWKWGKTGYPIVDAGMRELYATGWMTQNVRMVVASFLVEFLRVNWVHGCEWFHYTLVDADDAINPMMWQNAGRSGIDQWNFVLSPENASQDPTGNYTKRWVPELGRLPTKDLIHRPWQATKEVLNNAGVVLGKTYPHRVVTGLKTERSKSVEAVLEMRRKSQHANDDRGYDVITLPNGDRTVVFTKKEFRIDEFGHVTRESGSAKLAPKLNGSTTSSTATGRRRRQGGRAQ